MQMIGFLFLLLIILFEIVPSCSVGNPLCCGCKEDDVIITVQRKWPCAQADKWVSIGVDDIGSFQGGALVQVLNGSEESDIVIGSSLWKTDSCASFGVGYWHSRAAEGAANKVLVKKVESLDCTIGDQVVKRISIIKLWNSVNFGRNINGLQLPWDENGNVKLSKVDKTGTTVGRMSPEKAYGTKTDTWHQMKMTITDKNHCAPDIPDILKQNSICAAPDANVNRMGVTDGSPFVLDHSDVLYGIHIGPESRNAHWFMKLSACDGKKALEKIRNLSDVYRGIYIPFYNYK